MKYFVIPKYQHFCNFDFFMMLHDHPYDRRSGLKLIPTKNNFIIMSLNPPTRLFFMISLILAIMACVILFTTVSIPFIGAYGTYLLVGAYAVLAASCILKGV
jgi:hypothetical protein